METLAILAIIFVIGFVRSLFDKSDDQKGPSTANGNGGKQEPFASIRYTWLNNYNFRRASELLDTGAVHQAFEYLNKAFADDPDNAYAHSLMGLILLEFQDYDTAVTAFTTAIQNTPESEHAFFFVGRSRAHAGLGNEEKRFADIRNALYIEPGNDSALMELAEYHFCHGEYAESDCALDKLLELYPDKVFGHMAKGRNELIRGNWEHAIELFEQASALDDTYVAAWSYKAEALMRLGKFSQSIDCEITALELADSAGEPDEKALFLMNELARKACDLFCLKMRAKVAMGSQKSKWMAAIGKVYATASRYVEAAHWYHEAYEQDHETNSLFIEAYCWSRAGNYTRQAELLRQVLREDPDSQKKMGSLAFALAEQGDYEAAIAQSNERLRLQPDLPGIHFNRARFKQILGRNEEAIADYTVELSLRDGNDANSYLFRGMAYRDAGDEERSREDFTAITSDPDMEDREAVLPLAYTLLDDREKALESLECLEESLLEVPDEQSDYRIKALVLMAETLFRLGEKEKAIERMREALELGANRFNSYRRTPETRMLRTDARFEELLQEYETKIRESWTRGQEDPAEASPRQDKEEVKGMAASMIPFNKEGGVFKVPCKVNGLPLHFVFDTGASDVTISTVEATFMLKNGYLKKQDICGSEYYMTANGEISEGTAIRIREVDFGGMRLTNVKASVVRSQSAPLLLGQSVLQRLGRIEIDNDNRVIRINKKELPQELK